MATVVFATASETGDCSAHATDSRKFLATIRAAIDESSGISSRRKREIVTALLVGDFQIDTSLLPFNAVRRNLPTTSAKLGENMGQLVPQSSIDFDRIFQ